MPFAFKKILKGLTPYGVVRLLEKRRNADAAPPPVGPGGIRIICYEDLDAWILGKFARRMRDELYRMALGARISPNRATAARQWAIISFTIIHRKNGRLLKRS